MDRVLLKDAVRQLEASLPTVLGLPTLAALFAPAQAVRQFNSLLEVAKEHYPSRPDITSIASYPSANLTGVSKDEFSDTVRRLRQALDLRSIGSSAEVLAAIKLPSDVPGDLALDFRELEGAISLEMTKTALMLSGSIAEALLLSRHPDKSDRGPGLKELANQAKKERLFGRDTLRHLETLIDYRDLIHVRAEKRNQTFRNEARVSSALSALKLLCAELEDITVRYGQ